MSDNDKYELPKDEKDPVQEAALLTIIKRYADFSEKVCKELGLSGGGWSQCSREYNGKRYRVIVAEYEHCPVEELTRLSRALAGRDPEKLEGLLEAVRNVMNDRHTFHGKDDDKDWCRVCGQNFRDTGRHFIVGETAKTDRDALRAALAAFEGEVKS